ncbi:eukaryotic translation initiation factor 2D [Danaus plexippus plexippus]|uniref:Eukaryotic translation initiation factor 2D n=1 Tax=Danaus plexippus plexippus TaxID=278856 RepID=A0A212FFS6_DANPL|nr:eukaryotic translation initiation factor 2D [Danaus plexippus plexippus]
MFAKPYKLKSNNTLKNSGKKQLAQRIQYEFPAITEEKVKELIPNKSNVSYMEVVLHSGDIAGVYVVDGVPVMIDLGESLLPTVCALWKAPDLVPIICIHTPVLSKIQGGAPLYVPGVNTHGQFPQYRSGAVVAACTGDNAAACIVGRATISSAELLRDRMGVCLEILHVFGDQLCKEKKFMRIERPKLDPASYNVTELLTNEINKLNIQPVKEEWPSLVKAESSPINEPAVIADSGPETITNVAQDEENNDLDNTADSEYLSELSREDSIPSDMDGLLRWCLLSFLKLEAKHIELPLKTNLLYKNHLMPLCPSDRTLDVKKSSFKKMGKFLEAMQREGLIEVREIEKGVDALVSVATSHPLVTSHRAVRPRAAEAGGGERAAEDDYVPPTIRELYCITANVVDLFQPLKKGTPLSAGEVRATLTEYIKSHELVAPQARGSVVLDGLLAKVTGKRPEEVMKREEVTSCVLGRMTAATETRFADGTLRLSKVRLQPVSMQVVMRSGNKKVTLVSNLQDYGLDLSCLARQWQAGVGAACGVTRSAASKNDQLMIQGDQTHFVAKMLIEKYGLPKKFLEGADKALNKKK